MPWLHAAFARGTADAEQISCHGRARPSFAKASEGSSIDLVRRSLGEGGSDPATEISLDRSTGIIRVHNFWCAIDCGIPVHPDNVVAQTEGSIVYGLGISLRERITVKNGAIMQSNFHDYQVPRMRDVPAIEVALIPTDNHPTGAGQIGTPIVGPAIANAMYRLTGVRLRHSPMTPARVKQALA